MTHCYVKEESEVCREGQKKRGRESDGESEKEDERFICHHLVNTWTRQSPLYGD